MGIPDTVTMLDMTGSMVLNKTLSDPSDPILALQGVNWMTRKVIGLASITLHVKHYKDDEGVEHIDVESVASGGATNTEKRALNWEDISANSPIFGHTFGKSRRVKLEDIEIPFLKEEWIELDNGLVETVASSDTEKSGRTWNAHQVWGFAMIEGERRHVRRIHITGQNDEVIEARMIYDAA